jgi:toxin ParE1/3/4
MIRYKLTKEAVRDLEDIWSYTFEKWSVEQADRYYHLIIDEIGFIASNPHLGKSRDYIIKGYRSSNVKSHIVFYKMLNDDKVLIVRILHQSMDIESKIR